MTVLRNTSGWVRLCIAAAAIALLSATGCIVVTTPIEVDAGLDVATTTGATVVLHAQVSGGAGSYTFAWTPATELSDPASQNPTYQAVTLGVHVLTVTVTDSTGQSTSDSLTITVTDPTRPLVANAGSDAAVPVGAPFTMDGSATGGVGSYTYVWSPTTDLSSATAAQPTLTPTVAGTTRFTLTVKDGAGQSASDTVDITSYVETTLTSLTWAPNASSGYQILAAFNSPLNKAIAETASLYHIHGSGTAATTAVLGSDNQTVTVTFTTEPLTSASTFDLGVAAAIQDANGNPVRAVSNRPADLNPADTTVPTVASRTWGVDASSGYQVVVQFSEAMDRLTAQSVSAYRLDGLVSPQAAVLGGDGHTLVLTFASAAASPTATIDVGVGNTVRDVNGLILTQTTGQSIADNSIDTTPPTVASARHAAGFTSAGYQIDLQFSEAMSRIDVENASGYSINGVAASSAVLSTDSRTVFVNFQTPIASTDQITVGMGGTIKDINGNAAAQTTLPVAPSPSDLASPAIAARAWIANAVNYQVLVTFSESMDKATATTTTNYAVTTPSGSASPTVASLDNTGKKVTLTFGTTGSGLRPTETLTVSNGVLDINLRPNSSTSATSIAIDPSDVTAPTVTSRTWGPDLTQYQAILTFSEVLDRTSAVLLTNYQVQGNGGVDPRNPASASLDTTGRIVTLTFGTTTAGFKIGDTLSVALGVLDINGKLTGSTSPSIVTANTNDVTPPAVQSSTRVDATHADITFSEVMDKATVEAAAYTMTGGTVTGSALQADGRTVRLTTSIDPAGQTITVPTSVRDINGNSPVAPLTATP